MSAPVRRPTPAKQSRPLPSLEHVAAALAVTSLAVAPLMERVLPDAPCDDGARTGTLGQTVQSLEREGVVRAITGRASVAGEACPASWVMGLPTPAASTHAGPPTPPGAERMPVPGEMPVVQPVRPPVPTARRGAVRRVHPEHLTRGGHRRVQVDPFEL